MQSLRFWLGCFALCLDSAIEKLASLKRLGARIAKASTLTLALSLGGCATTQPPVTNTTGAVETLMTDPAYAEVRKSPPAVREWARKALHYVNDLSLELGRKNAE